MQIRQFLAACLLSCVVMQSNVTKGYADDATTVTPVPTTQQGEMDTNLQLSISPSQKRYQPGEPIAIDITLKNAGKADVPLLFALPLVEYQVEVVLPNGTKAVFSPEGERIGGMGAWRSFVDGVIAVGKERRTQITDLTRLYDMKRDGVYQITVSRIVQKSVIPNKPAKPLYRKLTPEELAEFDVPFPKIKPAPTEEEVAATLAKNGFIQITSNTIRIGIGEIPDGALDEKPLKDEEPVEKATPTKTDEAKSSPPVKQEVKK